MISVSGCELIYILMLEGAIRRLCNYGRLILQCGVKSSVKNELLHKDPRRGRTFFRLNGSLLCRPAINA